MRRFRSCISYANVMASIAIIMALGGTAVAATSIRANSITGAHVKNGTLTGVDIKNATITGNKIRNRSLTASDLSGSAIKSLKGATGKAGPAGPRGLTGEAGPKGDTGAPGAPAAVVTSFASRDTGYVKRRNVATPNPNGFGWADYNCNHDDTATGPCVLENGNQTEAGVGVIELIPDGTMVIALQGMSTDPDETNHVISSANNLQVPWANNLTGMASLTLHHRGTLHERAECRLQYANTAGTGTFADLGEPQLVSSYGNNELVTVSLVGSRNVSAGTYNVRVVCHDLDSSNDPTNHWRFVRGNMTAMAARNG